MTELDREIIDFTERNVQSNADNPAWVIAYALMRLVQSFSKVEQLIERIENETRS